MLQPKKCQKQYDNDNKKTPDENSSGNQLNRVKEITNSHEALERLFNLILWFDLTIDIFGLFFIGSKNEKFPFCDQASIIWFAFASPQKLDKRGAGKNEINDPILRNIETKQKLPLFLEQPFSFISSS